jgi:hypothetical protein
MQKCLSLIVLLCCFMQSVFSQNSPYKDISIASPTAAALGKYGDIPVNYHTGIPQISIPIYTIKSGPLQLPISLSYHASGLKVQEPSSWIGAGWSLNSGGVITRSVQGGPDEKGTNAGATETNGHFSDYGYNNYLYLSGQQDWQGIANGYKDGEPDLFFFNFGGYSGKFYFRDDRTPVIVPKADLKIVPDYPATGNTSIQSFVITTPDGVQYYFGNTPGITGTAPVEITNSVTAQNGLSTGTVISSWYLNKIVSPDNQFAINFIYQPENYGFFTLSMYPVEPVPTQNVPYEYNLVKNIIQGVRLSQIAFTNGYVNFVPGAARTDLSDNASTLVDNVNGNAKTLGAIQITDGAGFCKNYNLAYSYFTDNTSALTGYLGLSGFAFYNLATDKQRLKLNSLQEISCDAIVTIPPYQFTYFTEQVPRRLSFGIDHWGYYNGVTGNQTLIPTYTIDDGSSVTTVTGADRNSHWPEMRGGALQKITYPTGGSSIFDFDSHKVYSTYTQDQLISLTDMVVHQFGQSTYTATSLFTVTGAGSLVLKVINSSVSWSPTYSIKNSSGQEQLGGPFLMAASSTYTQNFTLPAGTYTASISFPVSMPNTATGGAEMIISQWRPVNITATILIGGLRINSITSNDPVTSNNIVTSYTYLSNGNSSAMLYSQPVYVGIVRNDLIRDVGYWTTNGFTPSLSPNGCTSFINATYYKSPSSIRPMATTQGFHVGYSSVTVSQTGNGYSVYNYFGNSPWPNASNGAVAITSLKTQGCDANAPNYPTAPLAFDHMRGELKYEAHYNQAGQLLKDINYAPVYTADPVTTPAFMVVQRGNQLLGTNYAIATAKKTQEQVTETIYTPGIGNITTVKTVYYESAFHNQVTRTSTTNSNAELLESKQKYTSDFRIPACDAIADGIVQYNTSCTACLATYNTTRTAANCVGNATCLTNAYLGYLQCLTNARIAYVNYQKINFTNPANAFKTSHDNAKTAADAELKPVLELQDQNIVTPIEVSSWRAGQLLNAAYYRYDYSANPANKVYISKSQFISLAAKSAGFTNASVNAGGTSITKDSRYKDEASFKFSAGNPVEQTPKSGITVAYLWDYKNTQPSAQVTGAASNQVAYTSFEADGNGNLTYATAKTPDITSPTGGYCYSLVSGAVQRTGLTSTSSYILSYWQKAGAAITVTAGTQSNIVTGPVRNGWTYKQLQFTGSTTAGISGTGFIDEVRIYPLGAQMTTYTYSPLMGMMSACDANNKITRYEYNKLGMLKNIKDQNSNIKQNFIYNYGLLPGVF